MSEHRPGRLLSGLSLPAGMRGPDVAVALGLLVLAAATATWFAEHDANGTRERDALGWALVALQTLPLVWRQTAPRLVFFVTLAAWTVDVGLAYQATLGALGLLVAVHAVGAFLPRRAAFAAVVPAFALAVGWTVVGSLVMEDIGGPEIIAVAMAVVIPFAMGRADAARRDRLTDLELRHQSAVQAQHEAAAAAVRTERARIARELHDVVAHEITVMTLQAEGARRMTGDAAPQVSAALRTISDSGRKGLAEMQRMIGVLRDTSEATEGQEDDPTIGSPFVRAAAHDLSPVPSLSALPALSRQVEDAGLPVDLSITGDAHVPAGVELSAYRIAQESLTNALKHAGPGATARVVVKRAKNAVTVTVEDDGRGVVSEAAAGGGGHGLAGMRERVAALGGSIEFGPRPGGGFRVRAVLPSHDDTIRPVRRTDAERPRGRERAKEHGRSAR